MLQHRSTSELKSDRIGQRVRIKAGTVELAGKTGLIVALEDGLFRVRLDRPVEVPGSGMVESDLWDGRLLRTLRDLSQRRGNRLGEKGPRR